jgi:hypothetical protein
MTTCTDDRSNALENFEILDRRDAPHDFADYKHAILEGLFGGCVPERLSSLGKADLQGGGAVDSSLVPRDPMPNQRAVLQFDFISCV